MLSNVLIVGKTRWGKSTAALHLLNAVGGQVVALDQQADSTAWALHKAFLNLGRQAVYDKLDDQERHFPLNLLDPANGIARERNIEELMETLIRRRGSANVDANPLIEMWTELWCRLIPPHWTLKKALQIFRNGDVFQEAVDLCQDDECRSAWLDLPAHAASRERITGAAERLVSILGKETIACRTYRGTNTFLKMIDEGWSFLSDGGQVIPQGMVRFIMATRMKQLNRYKMAGGKAEPTVVIEESEAGEMIGRQEAIAIQTLGKTGIKYIIICQEPFWIDDQVTDIVMQNTNHMWFRCGSQKVAELAAKDLCGVMFNPRAIKEHLERPFQIGDDKYIEKRVNYFTPAEQMGLIVKWVMSLPVGACFARSGETVRYCQFPKWHLNYCDELAEQKRKTQPCLISTGETGTRAGSIFMNDIRTPFPRQSGRDTFPRTRSPLDDSDE